MSFEQFCEQHRFASDTCRQPTCHQNQIDWLLDEQNNIAVDYVYKVEDFQTATREIASRTQGRVKLKNKVLNQNQVSQSSNYRELYSEQSKQLIAERFEKDIDTFQYTF
jgi:hypothetical protein